jgi:hypothetical protein
MAASKAPAPKAALADARAKQYERDKHADRIRQLREAGQGLQEIADELGRSKTDIARMCNALGCASAAQRPSLMV